MWESKKKDDKEDVEKNFDFIGNIEVEALVEAKVLNDAIVNLDKTSLFPSIASQDLIYKGDIDNWKKFAYGLLARYTMRLSKVVPNYDKVIEYANKSFASAAEH